MKTRNLILLSVACGFLILLAGAFKLRQVAVEPNQVPVNGLGTAATIGDMTVNVRVIRSTANGVDVTIEMNGVEGEPVLDGWRLLGDGEVLEPSNAVASGSCSGETRVPELGTSVTCKLRFAAVEAVQNVAYSRAGEQRLWAP